MADSDKLSVIGGAYDVVADAMKDFAEIQALHVEGEIGAYDAAILTKEPSGMLQLSNVDSTGHFKGGAAGAMVGAVLGAVFPPSLIGMAALGAGAGALAGGLRSKMGRGDFKSLGDLLEPGETGVLLVAETITESAANAILENAKRKRGLLVEGGAEEIKAAIRATAGK